MTKETDNLDNISFIQYLNRMVLEEAKIAITTDLPGDDEIPASPVRVEKDKNGQNIGVSGDNSEPVPEAPPKTEEQEINEMLKKNILKRRHRMYGIKNPLVWVLEKIADTELKIEKQRPSAPAKSKEEPMVLGDKDQAIIKHFIETHSKE